MTAHDLALTREAEGRRLDEEIAAAIADESEMIRFGILRRMQGSCVGLFRDEDFRSGELRGKRSNDAT